MINFSFRITTQAQARTLPPGTTVNIIRRKQLANMNTSSTSAVQQNATKALNGNFSHMRKLNLLTNNEVRTCQSGLYTMHRDRNGLNKDLTVFFSGPLSSKKNWFSTSASSGSGNSDSPWNRTFSNGKRELTDSEAAKADEKKQMSEENAKIALTAAEVSEFLNHPRSGNKLIALLPSDAKRQIGLAWAVKELRKEFDAADVDHDGVLTLEEFEKWAKAITEKTQDLTPPSRLQLQYTFIRQLPPFIGFGFVDNSLMIISGDVIDGYLGFYFGISTMAAAALGNAFSNGLGMMLHGVIEKCANSLGLPDPQLTIHQLKDGSVQTTRTAGSVVGILTGCLLGMCPLLFMDAKSSHAVAAKNEE